jgi:hypothetical protein
MGRLFHHLKTDEGRLGPVTKRSLRAWLDQIRNTELETVNAETEAVTADGYRATVGGGAGFDNTGDAPHWGKYPWEVTAGTTGWVVTRGQAGIFFGNLRTPRIGGVAISGDNLSDPPPTTRPELTFKSTDDVICVEMHFSINHPTARPPYNIGALPIRATSAAWLSWPEIRWLSDVVPLGGAVPGAGPSVVHRRAVPIAAVRGGKAYRLMWTRILLRHYPTTSHPAV